MAEFGLKVDQGEGMTRVQVSCMHQSGLLYVVPAERSWVCTQEYMPAHAIAGFLKELMELKDQRVKDLMQSWGIYFRELPLGEEPDRTQP